MKTQMIITVLGALLATGPVSAALLNGMESAAAPGGGSSSTAITSVGDATFVDALTTNDPSATPIPLNATQGTNYGVLTTGRAGDSENVNVSGTDAVTVEDIAGFTNTTVATLSGLAGVSVSGERGSAFKFEFDVTQSSTLTFDSIFITNEGIFSSNNDIAYYTLKNDTTDTLLGTFLLGEALNPLVDGNGGSPIIGDFYGYKSQWDFVGNSIAINDIGHYTLAFGVVDIYGFGVEGAGLAIDNVQFGAGAAAVPAPSVLLAMLVGLGVLRRRT